MDINAAQWENRIRFSGGFYGQLVSGLLWLASASLATWRSDKTAIATLVLGGFFIFPLTELLVRLHGGNRSLSRQNPLPQLGMQVALVLPFSMPVLVPVCHYHLALFYPAMAVLLGAHYLPFVFLYGMRMFAILAALLVGGGISIAMYMPGSYGAAAWYTGALLVAFAVIGKLVVQRDQGARSVQQV